jgi:hypothetical protein
MRYNIKLGNGKGLIFNNGIEELDLNIKTNKGKKVKTMDK